MQSLTIAWDVQKKRWYSVYPDQVIPPTEEGKTAEAESALRTALKADPQMAPAAYNLAVLVAPKNLAEALELSRRAGALRPEEPRYAFTLAFYQRQRGDASAAMAPCRRSSYATSPTERPTCSSVSSMSRRAGCKKLDSSSREPWR
jgi:hypothetical protein